jgi:hypothetical protein
VRALAQELVGLKPDIILTQATPTTAAVQGETRTIPIVFANVADPVASGFVPRLDRPGGNITGFASFEAPLGGKWLELLSEIAPGLKRAAIMSAATLNQEGFVAARGGKFKGENVWLLRKRWDIPTVKINGVSSNPMRWPDGSFSIQGAASALDITTQTVFDYLARGLLAGHQLTKGQPWQIDLSNEQISRLRARVRHTKYKRSKKEASWLAHHLGPVEQEIVVDRMIRRRNLHRWLAIGCATRLAGSSNPGGKPRRPAAHRLRSRGAWRVDFEMAKQIVAERAAYCPP